MATTATRGPAEQLAAFLTRRVSERRRVSELPPFPATAKTGTGRGTFLRACDPRERVSMLDWLLTECCTSSEMQMLPGLRQRPDAGSDVDAIAVEAAPPAS